MKVSVCRHSELLETSMKHVSDGLPVLHLLQRSLSASLRPPDPDLSPGPDPDTSLSASSTTLRSASRSCNPADFPPAQLQLQRGAAGWDESEDEWDEGGRGK